MVWIQTSPSGWYSGGCWTPWSLLISGKDVGQEAERIEQLKAAWLAATFW